MRRFRLEVRVTGFEPAVSSTQMRRDGQASLHPVVLGCGLWVPLNIQLATQSHAGSRSAGLPGFEPRACDFGDRRVADYTTGQGKVLGCVPSTVGEHRDYYTT